MSSPAPTSFTETEYVALERASDRKHEFIDGAIVAMAGARPPHNMIAANVTAALVVLTRGRGGVTMTSDQRVHVPATRFYAYPDVSVTCGERRYTCHDPPSLLNPTVLVEVTSDSTEDFDRGTKFIHYQTITELSDYVIMSHRAIRADHFRRQGDGQWHLTTHTRSDSSVELAALGGCIIVADAYAASSSTRGAGDERRELRRAHVGAGGP